MCDKNENNQEFLDWFFEVQKIFSMISFYSNWNMQILLIFYFSRLGDLLKIVWTFLRKIWDCKCCNDLLEIALILSSFYISTVKAINQWFQCFALIESIHHLNVF